MVYSWLLHWIVKPIDAWTIKARFKGIFLLMLLRRTFGIKNDNQRRNSNCILRQNRLHSNTETPSLKRPAAHDTTAQEGTSKKQHLPAPDDHIVDIDATQ